MRLGWWVGTVDSRSVNGDGGSVQRNRAVSQGSALARHEGIGKSTHALCLRPPGFGVGAEGDVGSDMLGQMQTPTVAVVFVWYLS